MDYQTRTVGIQEIAILLVCSPSITALAFMAISLMQLITLFTNCILVIAVVIAVTIAVIAVIIVGAAAVVPGAAAAAAAAVVLITNRILSSLCF